MSVFGMVYRSLLVLVFLVTLPVQAHEHWISSGSFRNKAGEWCCGVADCGIVDANGVHAMADGYHINGNVVIGDGEGAIVEHIEETVPFSESSPSKDGLYWRCKRPDGSRRCFFAPPPSM